MVLQRVVKPSNQRVKRALVKKEAKIHENDKTTMFIKGGQTSETVTQALKDMYMLKKPLAVMYKKKNIMRPLDDCTSVEFFANKNDSSMFAFGSHSKKRPHNLVLGRLYDFHALDMIELGIENFKSLKDFQSSKSVVGSKPGLLFAGEAFDQDIEHQRLKNLLIDFFRGPVVSNLRLSGLEHVLSFTAAEGKVFMRTYRIHLKKSGSRVPRVELEEMGPTFDFVMRRTKLAADDLFKHALKQPKTIKPRKIKNVSHDPFGSKLGRIHMEKQDLGKLQIRKLKGLKKRSLVKDGQEKGEEKSSAQEEPMETEGHSPKKSKKEKKAEMDTGT